MKLFPTDSAFPQIVLDGVSLTAPCLIADSLTETLLVAWTDARPETHQQICISISNNAPFTPSAAVNPSWQSFDSPSAALATQWEDVFLAWTDLSGNVQVGSAQDGWNQSRALTMSNSVSYGPALEMGEDFLYIAWVEEELLFLATYDKSGNINIFNSFQPMYSRPSLYYIGGTLFAMSGGSIPGEQDNLLVYVSKDDGQSFEPFPSQSLNCLGAASLQVDEYFYLAWADSNTLSLCFSESPDLNQLQIQQFPVGCHGGSPSLARMIDPNSGQGATLVAWTVGAPPEDPTNHHISVGLLPNFNDSKKTTFSDKNLKRLAKAQAPNPCPDPNTIYDPATNQCVSRFGCWGNCVSSSFTSVGGFPVFNPIA